MSDICIEHRVLLTDLRAPRILTVNAPALCTECHEEVFVTISQRLQMLGLDAATLSARLNASMPRCTASLSHGTQNIELAVSLDLVNYTIVTVGDAPSQVECGANSAMILTWSVQLVCRGQELEPVPERRGWSKDLGELL